MEWDDEENRIAVFALHKIDQIQLLRSFVRLIVSKCLCAGLLIKTMKPPPFLSENQILLSTYYSYEKGEQISKGPNLKKCCMKAKYYISGDEDST